MTNDLSPRHDDASSDGLDVPSATASLASPDAAARYDDALKEACERIASRYLLSQRQTEVLYLLARGHTAPYIQDKLCVTLSTAKSHIYNIYKKLDIHKQHELLSMVESEIEDHA
ncbi:MAG: LuxR C-terminal-related transcriptional regulator [Eggerthellaceae bacterium]|nr:LuxR C-terminal-related transcriptional regulator [Eggerthellaceae bacterium]